MHRKRRGARGRFPIQPRIVEIPKAKKMTPEPMSDSSAIYIDLAEIEALRLVDLEGLYQEEAGRAMGVSRGTIWRILASARKKVILSLFEGRPLIVGLPADNTED
ncbi:MAG: DUF134 domain-containing protein [Candidatus Thorarchaeota archaeon]